MSQSSTNLISSSSGVEVASRDPLPPPDSVIEEIPELKVAPHKRGARRFLARYLTVAGADVVGKALAYAAMIIVIRHFGAAGYGALSFAASVVSIAMTIATFGLDLYAVREAARYPERLTNTAVTIVALRLLFGTIVYAMLLIGTTLVPSLGNVSDLIAILGLSLLISAVTVNWISEALQKAVVIAATNIGTQGFGLLLLLTFLYARAGIWSVAIAQVTAELVIAVALYIWARKFFWDTVKIAPFKEWRSVVVQSAPMGWSRVMRAATFSSDTVILGLLVSFAEVGWYSGAFRLYILFLTSVGLYSILLLPRLSGCAKAGNAAVWKEVRASFRRILPLAVVCVCLAMALSRFLLVTMFDPTFAVATTSLYLLLISLLVSLISGHFRLALIALDRQREDSVAVTVSTGVHLGLKLALIPVFGITGAALGTCLGEFFLLGAMIYLVRRGQRQSRAGGV